MSLSSGTTLISPSATTASIRSTHHNPPPAQRRPSHHSQHSHAHTTHAHHPKRKASNHAHTTHTHHAHAGPSNPRRPSDEGGRRAVAAGLAMHVLDSAGAGELKLKRSKSRERAPVQRPLTKTSRSDTHLPRLSRTTSMTSEASGSSGQANQRPKKDRKRSGESVQVLSEDGREAGEVVDGEEEEGWESGEEPESKSKVQLKEDRTTEGKETSPSAAMRRTVSDTQAEAPPKSGLFSPPIAMPEAHTALLTQRTTGFAGVQTPAADPALEAQAHHNVVTPHWNDPTHIMPAHQIRHQQSARTLSVGPGGDSVAHAGAVSAIDGDKTPRPGSVARSGSGGPRSRQQEHQTPQHPQQPHGPERMRSTDGSGLPTADVKTSPAFPFPKVVPPPVPQQQPTPPTSADSIPTKPQLPKAQVSEQPRHRLASGTEPPRLRHRYSNSSLRSIQSLRAPPHPLNSPTGYRTALPTVATSRPGSAFNSPSKGEKRGLNMHYPPMAAPVVNREVIKGEGWPIPEESETTSSASPAVNGDNRLGSGSRQRTDRKSSVSSQASLAGIINSSAIKGRPTPSPSSSSTGHTRPLQPSRRMTAKEVAEKAARMQTTNDPVEYHHSLGYPSTSAETAHLISRFLPQKKNRRPEWEITQGDPNASEFANGCGLTRGDYRDAHESLIRMMKDISGPANVVGKRAISRTLSYQTLLGPGAGVVQDDVQGSGVGAGVGMTKGRSGTMVVAKGGWRGRTPFELSVERCLAQRPQRAMSGL